MNRREASKKETRRLILKIARKLFAQKGMEECTIRDIAKKARVSAASVIVHFKSKTALLEEVFSTDVGKAISHLMTSMPKDAELADQLMFLSKGMINFYAKNKSLYRAILRYTMFEPTTETPNMSRQSEQYVQFLSGLIEEQKRGGFIRPDVDSMIAAGSIFSLYLGALTILFRMPEMPTEEIANILASMTGQYLNGIYVDRKTV
jgi:AcrR family transcriptional regulator